jgi:hypothetical protein
MTTAIFEGAFGLDLAPERYDVLMQTHATPEMQARELTLMERKWFDYRFLHPTAATYLMANAFRREYKNAYARYFDYRTANHREPIHATDLFRSKPGKITGIWEMRQCADAICAPYDLFARWAIDVRMRFWKRAFLPQPSQLNAEIVRELTLEKWNEHQTGVLMAARHEAYLNANYCGLPAQDAHHDWLFMQAEKRLNIRAALRDLAARELLPAGKIEARYGAEVTSRVLEAA